MLAQSYAHSLATLVLPTRTPWRRRLRPGVIAAAIAAILAIATMLPVRISVLASAETIPQRASIARAALDGVIDELHVQPGDQVETGTLLASLDEKPVEHEIDIAARRLELAKSELRRVSQEAVVDREGKLALNAAQGELKRRQADYDYALSLRERLEIRASVPGIVLLEDPRGWIGRPVQIGEMVMTVADPTQSELEIWLAIADQIALPDGAEVQFYPNTNPHRSLKASLDRHAYRAVPSPEGYLAYRLVAKPTSDGQTWSIGQRGTAKIYGDDVSLLFYLFRRPFVAIRRYTGL
jgi:multidrug efflux pump subunit AcrA (membrane-fusion protein)